MPPEVTAVITTHARPAAVCQALASVVAEVQDVEVVIVDDGGTFVAPDSAIPIRVAHSSHLGVARARNVGLAAARGEFVIYLDDDDIALPNRISRLLSAAREHDASLCFGMTRRAGERAAIALPDVPTHAISSGPVGFCDLLTCAPHVNSVLVRTEALRAVGGFDAGVDHFDDWAAWLRIADREAVLWRIADTVAEWRVHAEGLTGQLLLIGAMKRRILSLFDHLLDSLSIENAQAVAAAREVVESSEITTYDDYAAAMARARQAMHADGSCFGRSLPWHRMLDTERTKSLNRALFASRDSSLRSE